jgi:hypothetical protein
VIKDVDIRYIGSTFNLLRYRWSIHKSKYKIQKGCSIYPYFDKYGIESFKIQLIKEYKVYADHDKDHKHLSVYEQLWINKLKCVNKQAAFTIPFIQKIKKLISIKKYRENNKETITISSKKYRNNNKEKEARRHKKYNEENKEKVAISKKKKYEKNKEKVTCECGAIFDKSHLTRHQLTKKHMKRMDLI